MISPAKTLHPAALPNLWKVAVLFLLSHALAADTIDADFRSEIEKDWARQEERLGRQPATQESIRAALQRADKLLLDLKDSSQIEDLAGKSASLASLKKRAESVASLDDTERLTLYHQIRWWSREVALANPLVSGKPLVFMKRNRFICQMLHEYLGYFYDYGSVEGGGVFLLEEPGRSTKVRDLVAGRLPRGNYATLALSYDAKSLYFAFAERAPTKPNYYSKDRRSFHIYGLNLETNKLQPLTDGVEDDFDPCPLPDGGIAFVSSRRGAFCRCNNPWEPIPTYTLHRMEKDGGNLQTLSFHETNEWHPFVLNDGRIVYTRWDYVDRSAANFHGLWITNPDGTGTMSLFGNYTMDINACYQPRSIPGSSRVIFVAGAHHADVGGSLVIVDPEKVALDPKTGEDDFRSLEFLTPEVCFAEANGWPKSYFHSPWPLSENYYLVSFSFDPLPGMSSGESRDTKTGLYYFDRWGNLELLYRDEASSAMYPVPVAPRAVPPVVAKSKNPELGDEGEFLVQDVRQSHFPWPSDRPAKELRVFELLPKTGSHIANEPRIGYANAENARSFLGTVPVENDGSAFFRAPAGKPLYFQVVDQAGRAIQSMRSATYLQRGERRSCIGCHEGPNASPPSTVPVAARREPSRLQPGPEGSQPMSFARLIQPVLDRNCVRCHDGTAGPAKSDLVLLGTRTKVFSASYDNLRKFVRWYEWGGESISQIATHPGQVGADHSPLTKVLQDKTHSSLLLPEEDLRRLYLWLDANAPFYGTFDKTAQAAQRTGQLIPSSPQ